MGRRQRIHSFSRIGHRGEEQLASVDMQPNRLGFQEVAKGCEVFVPISCQLHTLPPSADGR